MTIKNNYPFYHFKNLGAKWRQCYICNRWFSEGRMIERDGHYFCVNDYNWRYNRKDEDEWVPDYSDDLE